MTTWILLFILNNQLVWQQEYSRFIDCYNVYTMLNTHYKNSAVCVPKGVKQ